jgi:hypothetical protein
MSAGNYNAGPVLPSSRVTKSAISNVCPLSQRGGTGRCFRANGIVVFPRWDGNDDKHESPLTTADDNPPPYTTTTSGARGQAPEGGAGGTASTRCCSVRTKRQPPSCTDQ